MPVKKFIFCLVLTSSLSLLGLSQPFSGGFSGPSAAGVIFLGLTAVGVPVFAVFGNEIYFGGAIPLNTSFYDFKDFDSHSYSRSMLVNPGWNIMLRKHIGNHFMEIGYRRFPMALEEISIDKQNDEFSYLIQAKEGLSNFHFSYIVPVLKSHMPGRLNLYVGGVIFAQVAGSEFSTSPDDLPVRFTTGNGIGVLSGASYKIFDNLKADMRYELSKYTHHLQLGLSLTYNNKKWWKKKKGIE